MQKLPELRTGRTRVEQGMVKALPEFEIPFGIIEGATPGPCLVVTAGVHGAEYCSIEAAARLMRIDPQTLSGTLLVLPILNVSGFQARSIFIMPEDGKNLNRAFPGRADGSTSEQLANWLVTEVFSQADAYLDLHGGDMNETLDPFTIYAHGHVESETLAVAFGLPAAVGLKSKGSTISASAAMGIPSVLVEIGGNGLWSDEEVRAMLAGIERVMARLGMIKSAPPAAAASRLMTFSVPFATASGLWYPTRKPGDRVAAGDHLGDIRDIFGKALQAVTAEASGEILYQLSTLAVNDGEVTVAIGVPVEHAA